jgi:hypothetical protein
VIDVSAFQMLLLTVTSWLDQREREVLAYLIEENRVLRRQLGGRRIRLTDDDRRTLAARAYRLGRQALRESRRSSARRPIPTRRSWARSCGTSRSETPIRVAC